MPDSCEAVVSPRTKNFLRIPIILIRILDNSRRFLEKDQVTKIGPTVLQDTLELIENFLTYKDYALLFIDFY